MVTTLTRRQAELLGDSRLSTSDAISYRRPRYYNPTVGRFTEMDPFSGDAQSPQSLHKYLYCQAEPVNSIDPSGEFSLAGLTASMGFGSALGALTAWTQGYDGWGIVGGAAIGAVLGGGLYLASPFVGTTGMTAEEGVFNVAGIFAVWYYYESSLGHEPTTPQKAVIAQATEIIGQTPGFQHYARALNSSIRALAYQSDPDSPWGRDLHTCSGRILLSSKLLDNVRPEWAASTIVHETHHDWQLTTFKSTWRGEQYAYQAQSDFLRERGVQGVWSKIKTRNTMEKSFLHDLADFFYKYRVTNPAITLNPHETSPD